MAADETARSIEPVLAKFLATELLYDREVTKVDPDEMLLGGLLDSVDIVNVVQFVEEQYGIRIEDDELAPENFETVRAVASLVSRKLADRDAAG